MSSYSLSGSGTHALTASTTGLQVTITTPSLIQGVGRSNPVAHYDVGLIRFSDGTSYWAPVPVLGGPQFIPVPANATSFGYALLGGAVISVVEVIGGTVFFSGGAQTVETLSDVQIASLVDGQTLTWVASAAKWENVTPAAPPVALSAAPYIDSVLAADAANFSLTISDATRALIEIFIVCRATVGGPQQLRLRLNGDTTSVYRWTFMRQIGNGNAETQGYVYCGDISGSNDAAGAAGMAHIVIPDYAGSVFRKQLLVTERDEQSPDAALIAATWGNTAAITSVLLYPATGNFLAGSRAMVYLR